MNTYVKPYIENIYGTSTAGQFPYTRELLCERPIFPTFVMDTGAKLLTRQVLGIDDGDDMLEKIMDGSIFDYYRRDGEFEWCRVLNDFRKTDFLYEWEAHIWLARMYILLPLAQKFAITRDRKYSDAWFKIFSHWKENNPIYPFDRNIHRFKTTMVWSDMQIVWRMLNLIYSIFMLSCDKDCFTPEQWCEIYKIMELHAQRIYDEAVWHAELHDADNHNLQMGMCMIMTGTLYPEFGHSEEFISTGKEVVKDNLEFSIFPDGVNEEGGISYTPFIARLYLEAHLLLSKNGHGGIEGMEESLEKQYSFIYQFSDPYGKTQQMGDSYTFDAVSDIELVKKLMPISITQKKISAVYENSCMAVLRNERFELFIDGLAMKRWHQHYGRMTYTLFVDGKIAVCDSGGVNYDCHDLREFLNSAQAHNTISVDGKSVHDFKEKPEIIDYSLNGEIQYITYVNKNECFTHERTFTLYSDRLEVSDKVEIHNNASLTNNIHLPGRIIGYYAEDAKNQPISENSTLFTQRINDKLLRVKTDTSFKREFVPCMNYDSLEDWCYALRIPVENGECHKTVITLE